MDNRSILSEEGVQVVIDDTELRNTAFAAFLERLSKNGVKFTNVSSLNAPNQILFEDSHGFYLYGIERNDSGEGYSFVEIERFRNDMEVEKAFPGLAVGFSRRVISERVEGQLG